MKQLINYCPVPGCDNDIPTTDEALKNYLNVTGLDGVELFIYQKQPYDVTYRNNIRLVCILSIGLSGPVFGQKEKYFLQKKFGTAKENMKKFYFGAKSGRMKLDAIKEHIKVALKEEPRIFGMWHVSQIR